MDFRVLGPLEVAGDDGPLALGGIRQRSLLAILLLQANQVVSRDRLIDALWGASPPTTCNKSLQVYVSRLRKLLDDDRIVTHAPGYELRVDADELDLARFERLLGEARRARPEAAAASLHEALELWRGPPLADLAYEQFAQAEVARLDELRVTAVEQRIEAQLALGEHSVLVGELEGLAAAHPLRERFAEQLMLDVYRDARRRLSELLGLEPGESLRRMEQAVLRHDPELDLPAAESPRAVAGNGTADSVPQPALLVAPAALDALGELLALAQPLAAAEPAHELIVAALVDPEDVNRATDELAGRRADLLDAGIAVRTAAFSSPDPGEDLVRLASQESVDLLLLDVADAPLSGRAAVVLDTAQCDVAMQVCAGGAFRDGPVVVPFGAAEHDWAALELGAWIARATGARLRLMGAADRRAHGRDASRLLADASLIIQRTAGVVAEPLLAAPGMPGLEEAADGAGMLVVGLSERWREHGLGEVRGKLVERAPAPTVLVRRGLRPGGIAPAETRTRFSWSLAETAAG
jgi:DNA-binding SARP family transcriptional activator